MTSQIKKIALALAAAIIIFSCACADSHENYTQYGVVIPQLNSNVVLRFSPRTDSSVAATYVTREWFAVIDQDSTWLHVTMTDGNSGYLLKRQTEVASVSSCLCGVVANPEGTKLLNLRSRPDRTSTVIAQYESGVPFKITSKSGEWYHVKINGLDGYFHSDYVSTFLQPASESLATVIDESGVADIFDAPEKKSEQIGTCTSGSIVMLLESGETYSQIAFNGICGFVKSDSLKAGIVTFDRTASSSCIASVSAEVTAIRTLPGNGAPVVERCGAGMDVIVTEAGTEWCQVTTSFQSIGYVQTKDLFFSEQISTTKTVYHPDSTYVNMRKSPDVKTGEVLERVPHGSQVTVLAPGGEWTKISYHGKSGYMMSVYLR